MQFRIWPLISSNMHSNKSGNPPPWILKWLRWFCKPELAEDLEGDLRELYEEWLETSRIPGLLLFWETIRLLRPGIIKNNFLTRYSITQSMYNNYFKSAWRNLLKHKTFSMINVSSLSLGMAICMVIFLFAQEETSYDNFQPDDIYRFWETEQYEGSTGQDIPFTMGGVGPQFTAHYPELSSYVRVMVGGEQVVKVEDRGVLVADIKTVDNNFFQFFNFDLLHGSPESVLRDHSTVVISEATALKLYGSTDVVGRTFQFDDNTFTVNGVFKDVPANSHLQFNLLFSLDYFGKTRENFDNEFTGSFVTTYVKVNKEADIGKLQNTFPETLDKLSGKNWSENYTLYLQPLKDIHLGSSHLVHDYNNFRKFNRKHLYVFGLVGLLLLIIATINFMNLTTARSGYRAKEVGVRKTLGAFRQQLIIQFQMESILMAFIALLLALIILWGAFPYLNNLIERDFSLLSVLGDWKLMGGIIAATIIIGMLAGIYPSLIISSFGLVNVMKGVYLKVVRSYFRSGLVVLQFSLAIGMIVSTVIVIQQLKYINNRDLGFDKDHIIQVPLKDDKVRANYEVMKQELLNQSNIIGVTASGHRLGNDFHQRGFKVKLDSGISFLVPSSLYVDMDYLEVHGIKLLQGRTFSQDMAQDRGLAFVVNESMVKDLGLSDPIGTRAGMGWYPNDSLGTIIGVVQDFNFNTLHNEIDNLVIMVNEMWSFREMVVKVNGNNLKEGLNQLETIYAKYSTTPISYQFLDEHFETLYRSDQQMSAVLGVIGGLSILIGCMGLFGLSAITVQQRIKEIGIRKVLGAGNKQLMLLLSREFAWLVIISFFVASPIAYYFMSNWLNGFAYHVEMSPLYFMIGGLLSFAIAWLTVSIHVGKEVRKNPVESLRWD